MSRLVRNRIAYGDERFAETVVWRVPHSLPGSSYFYKCRLALVACGECVLRYDNEAGKGDHRHARGRDRRYRLSTLDKLFADFELEIRRYGDENSDP